MIWQIQSNRFDLEAGFEITVQVPQPHAKALLQAVYQVTALDYGDYDHVSFQTEVGTQRFRSLPGGRNAATDQVVEVPCVELSFFVADHQIVKNVVETLFAQHPYEEPVILIRSAWRTLHRAGMDEDNPNKFWNRPSEDWVPEVHRIKPHKSGQIP
ncbi:hypothetical protein [uncultured Ruegeria sp.]|uniref:hypothetical protein n=1 Tax=uncultured Ruegeria sp. TaxID=259304 RepID=UPI0026064C69|nr:hypothetical protein [uncultured Ruegeria sp.]